MNRDLIEQYAGGGDKLRAAIAGLTDAQLKAFPVPGTWSIQQIVIHLQDSDLIASDRMKRMIAENNPLITAYNDSAFSKDLFYHEQDVKVAVDLFDMNRRQFARVLRKLPDEAFERSGIHTERGKVFLGKMLEMYVGHLDHHLKFVEQKKNMVKGL